MSVEPSTLDTNILVYSIDLQAGRRHEMAKSIMQAARLTTCVLTLQSVSEFYAVVTRKGLMPTFDALQVATTLLDLFPTCSLSASAVRTALAAAVGKVAGYWDALLLATAAEAGCTAILTEDLAGGATLLGVHIINPFAGDMLSPSATALLYPE